MDAPARNLRTKCQNWNEDEKLEVISEIHTHNARHPMCKRTVREIKKQWQNLQQKCKQDFRVALKTQSQAGSGEHKLELSALTSAVLEVIGEDCPIVLEISQCPEAGEQPPAVAQLDPATEAVEKPGSSQGTILCSNISQEIVTLPVDDVPLAQNTDAPRQPLREASCKTIKVAGPSSHCQQQRSMQGRKNIRAEYEELLRKDAEMLEKDVNCLKHKVNAIENTTKAAEKISDVAVKFLSAIDEIKAQAIRSFGLMDEVSHLKKQKLLLEIESLKASKDSHKH